MKILAIADQHGLLDTKIPECDLLIVAGDLCPDRIGSLWARDFPEQQARWFVREWMDWRMAQPATHCLVTWGNHDFCGETNKFPSYPNTQIVTDDLVEFGGLKIWLSPWTKQFMKWAFMKEEQRLWDEHYNRIPEGIDILISHDPPYGFGDASPEWATGEIAHFGSRALLDTIKRVHPTAVVCGHIHDAYGVYELDVDYQVKDAGTYDCTHQVKIYNCALASGRATLGTLQLTERKPLEILL